MIRQVIRKDGVVYEKRFNDVLCDKNITVRASTSLIEKLKYIATKKGVRWNTMVRTILEEYVNNYIDKEM